MYVKPLSLASLASSPSRGASGETGDFAVIHCGLLLFPSAVKCHLPAKGPTIRGAVTVGDWGVEPQAAAGVEPHRPSCGSRRGCTKQSLTGIKKAPPFGGARKNYMGVKPFSTAASRPCPAHRGRCARQWCSRSAAGPHCTRRWGTWHAGRRGSASRAACPRRHRSRSPP